MEALAIAVAMREAREYNRSAALVTPDRALARRVMAALGRWNLAFDDSGGDALMDTTAGIFARLAAKARYRAAGACDLAGAAETSAVGLGAAPGAWTGAVETLELALLRGTRPEQGCAGLAKDFAASATSLQNSVRGVTSALHPSEPRTRLADAELDQARR